MQRLSQREINQIMKDAPDHDRFKKARDLLVGDWIPSFNDIMDSEQIRRIEYVAGSVFYQSERWSRQAKMGDWVQIDSAPKPAALATLKVLYRHPYNGGLYGLPYGMRPGQTPTDLLRANNTKGWIWLGSQGWWGSLSKRDQKHISRWLESLADVPQSPGEWCQVELA